MSTIEKINNILKDILDIEDLKINEQTSAIDIEEWDSLAHINIISEIERDFCIKFALGELQNLKNVGEMIKIIESKIN